MLRVSILKIFCQKCLIFNCFGNKFEKKMAWMPEFLKLKRQKFSKLDFSINSSFVITLEVI